MHMVGSMTFYSSSPPAVWSTQSALSGVTASVSDIDIHSRTPQAHHASPKPVLVGGLSSLFSSASTRPTLASTCSVNDVLDSSGHSYSSGMVRSSSQNDLAPWESLETRCGAVNVPVCSSLRLKERSPVSVLQAPASRGSSHNSPIFSLVAWESAASSGLPPLDPHLDRGSRRKSSFSVEARWPLSRSVGFQVGNDGGFPGDSQALHCPVTDYESTSTQKPDHGQGRVFNSSSSATPAIDSSTMPLFPFGVDHTITIQKETPELLEAREKVLSMTEKANGVVAASPAVCPTIKTPSSSDELLKDAQAQHKIFSDPFVIEAFRLAEDAHKGQFRRSGDLYLAHCVETALILAGTGADSTVVAAGLLHDTIDDCNVSTQLLHRVFGEDVTDLVLGVSKLSEFSQLARDNATVYNPVEADRLRTMFLAMVDVRVVLVKLADRLHNMRTLQALPVAKQLRIADETLEIFAPLANRLGIWTWKAELEDLCFKILKPDDYKELATRLAEGCREGLVMSSIYQLDQAMRQQGVLFTDLCGRPKNLYSIFKKMAKKGRTVEEIFDVRGLRLIVPDESCCYDALSVVHQLWAHIPGKLKDYISQPKANGYQSLHTVVWGDDGHPLEVQVRTMEMHHQAEFGLAAHWRYKEDNSKHSSFVLQRVEWARWVLTWQSEIFDTKLRVSPMEADLRPPCPFPVHKDDCPHAAMCCAPPLSEDDPLFVIMVEDENMIVQELPPGSTAADLVSNKATDLDSLAACTSRTSRKQMRAKVNHQFVENFQQKLRMGDLVELTPSDVSTEPSPVRCAERPCGKIALEFQREQLKRLYLDGRAYNEDQRRASQTTLA